MERKDKEPIHTVERGRIQLPIWENQREDGSAWFNVTVKRLFKSGGEWQESQTFGREDLLALSEGVTEAYRWIWEQRNTARKSTKRTA